MLNIIRILQQLNMWFTFIRDVSIFSGWLLLNQECKFESWVESCWVVRESKSIILGFEQLDKGNSYYTSAYVFLLRDLIKILFRFLFEDTVLRKSPFKCTMFLKDPSRRYHYNIYCFKQLLLVVPRRHRCVLVKMTIKNMMNFVVI